MSEHIEQAIESCRKRMEALDIRGRKTRDRFVIDFMCAYFSALLNAKVIDTVPSFIFICSVRGEDAFNRH